MQAYVQSRYGPPDVIRIETVERPTPKEDQVLVRIRRASVNPADWHRITGTPFLVRMVGGGFLRPKNSRTGSDLAGVVEAVGSAVTRFAKGDRVYGDAVGAFAEYAAVPERLLATIPPAVDFDQAAAVPIAGLTALQAIRDHGQVAAGERVLINGASGGVGTFSVQIAKAFGAEVTAVCSSRNVEMVSSIGADRVIDYTTGDPTATGNHYDVVIDNVGNWSLRRCKRLLSPGGRYVMVSGPKHFWLGPIRRMLAGFVMFAGGDRTMKVFVARANSDDLETIAVMMTAEALSPVIDRTYPFGQVVEALDYLAEGHARGKILIDVLTPGAA